MRKSQTIISIFIAIIFMAKSLVPVGFMPSFSDNKNVSAITICSGIDEKQIFIDENGQKVPAPSNSHSKSPVCEFSLASVFVNFEIPELVPFFVSFYVRPVHKNTEEDHFTFAQNFQARAPPPSHI